MLVQDDTHRRRWAAGTIRKIAMSLTPIGFSLTAGLLFAFPLQLTAQAPVDTEADRIQIDGPTPPVAPAVISRDDEGGVTVRAIRVTEPMRIDGELDESFYRTTPSISDFVQSVPDEGAAPTERTEAWIAFDDSNV